MTVIETKKPISQFIKENFYKISQAWLFIFIFFAVYFHILMLELFPLSVKAVHTWLASCYQIIGAACVLFQINGSLKILKGDDLIKSIKLYLGSWPKRTAQNTTINCKIANISLTSSASAKVIIRSESETLEEKIDRLSKRVDEIDKEINKNRHEIMDKIDKNQKQNDKRIAVINENIQKLKVNLESTIIGDYKTAIFGVLMIIYGIVIPIIDLYI